MRKSYDKPSNEVKGRTGSGVLGPEASVDFSTVLNPVEHYRRLQGMVRDLRALFDSVEK